MDWYIVIKTINGHRYRYRQKTWREGKHVRTRSEYIGPAGEAPSIASPSDSQGKQLASTGLEILLGEQASDWEQAFEETRDGPSLVEKDPRIEQLFRKLDVQWTHSTDGAYYTPGKDVVNIPPAQKFIDRDGQNATQAYYIVVFHELVHWTARHHRINRRTGTSRSDEKGYAREELVAELGATMLMKHFGVELGNPARHAHYFQFWLGKAGGRKASIAHAKREAQRAVQFILERGIINQ